MERTQVDHSSNISSVGFDEESSTLEIEFHSGAVYQYFDVPLIVYESLMGAESKGKYFMQFIKGFFRFVKV
ncbi:MAG: KTSC domain-containing protein [Ignavibacteria bacterium]|jgi:hypothetical protein